FGVFSWIRVQFSAPPPLPRFNLPTFLLRGNLMRLSKWAWLLALLIVIFGSTSALAQTRIQLVQGRRLIKDKVTFVVDVSPEKIPNPRYATAPEDLHIYTRFTEPPGTGMVYLDGKTLGRFDEAMSF